MKGLKVIITVLLVFIIIGGLGYIGWSMFFMPMNHTGMGNMTPNTNTPSQNSTSSNNQNSNMSGMNMSSSTATPSNGQNTTNQQSTTVINTIAIQNKDKLNQAITTINQAINLISIDPYASATVPGNLNNMNGNGQAQGSGMINIYPGGNTSVNITPSGNTIPNNTIPPANTNQGALNQNQNTNYVYDQNKLQQLNTGIYTLAQGIMLVNQLNDDLTAQSAIVEPNPPNYQTYVSRYSTALQNRTKLNNAINMINQASTLVNVNPYGSSNGYQFKVQEMQNLHQGVYKLAQGMTMMSRLSEDFTNQLVQASAGIQSLSGDMSAMNMTDTNGRISLTTIFNIILIIFVIGLTFGIIGALLSMFRKKPARNGNGDSGNEPGTL